MLDIDTFDECFKTSSMDDRFQMVLEVLMQDYEDEFLNEIDFSYYVIEVAEELHFIRAYRSIYKLAQLLQRYPCLNHDVIPFLSYYMIVLLLAEGAEEEELIRMHFTPFLLNPANYMDFLMRLLDWLILYRRGRLGMELGRPVYTEMVNYTLFDREPEATFSLNTLLLTLFDNYQKMQQQQPIDWETTREFLLVPHRYQLSEEEIKEAERAFTKPFEISPELEKGFYKRSDPTLRYVRLSFLCYLFKQRGIDFLLGNLLYSRVMQFLYQRSSASKTSMKSLFSFRKQTLAEYLVKLMSNLMRRVEDAFILLWGLPLVYQFFRETRLIDDKILQSSLKHIDILKDEMKKEFAESLWKYQFIQALEI